MVGKNDFSNVIIVCLRNCGLNFLVAVVTSGHDGKTDLPAPVIKTNVALNVANGNPGTYD